MTDELKAAILNARAASLNAEVAGMVAENQFRVANGDSVAYGMDAFEQAIANNRLGENGIIQTGIHGEL